MAKGGGGGGMGDLLRQAQEMQRMMAAIQAGLKDLVVEGTERKKVLRVYLKYSRERLPSIQGIKRESRPGLRKYCPVDKLPRVLGGLGIAILSTSAGIMTDREARKARVGGEFICSVW